MFILVGLSASASTANPLGIPDTEYQAVVALYNSTSGPKWKDHTNWLTHKADWYGVTVTGGHVTRLDLENNQLMGTIPVQIGNPRNLTGLFLGLNQLSGTISSSIGNLTRLGALNWRITSRYKVILYASNTGYIKRAVACERGWIRLTIPRNTLMVIDTKSLEIADIVPVVREANSTLCA